MAHHGSPTFRMSRFSFRIAFSRRTRLSSAWSSTAASRGSSASRSWLSHRVKVDSPRFYAISRRVRPRVSANRTASRRNSCVGVFPFPIEQLLVPQLVVSKEPGQVHFGGPYSFGAPHRRRPLRSEKIMPLVTRRSSILGLPWCLGKKGCNRHLRHSQPTEVAHCSVSKRRRNLYATK